MPKAMDDRDKWWKKHKVLRAIVTTWWRLHTHTHTHTHTHIYIYIYIYIYIIVLRYQHEYSWSSLATPPYRPLLSADPQGYIPYRDIAAVCRFERDILALLVHGKGSSRVQHLWTRPYFFSMSGSCNFGSFCNGW